MFATNTKQSQFNFPLSVNILYKLQTISPKSDDICTLPSNLCWSTRKIERETENEKYSIYLHFEASKCSCRIYRFFLQCQVSTNVTKHTMCIKYIHFHTRLLAAYPNIQKFRWFYFSSFRWIYDIYNKRPIRIKLMLASIYKTIIYQSNGIL